LFKINLKLKSFTG